MAMVRSALLKLRLALCPDRSVEAGLNYPMDSRLVFNISAVVSLGLYVLSLLLHVNVLGDFGVSSEGGGERGASSSSSSYRLLEDIFGISTVDLPGRGKGKEG